MALTRDNAEEAGAIGRALVGAAVLWALDPQRSAPLSRPAVLAAGGAALMYFSRRYPAQTMQAVRDYRRAIGTRGEVVEEDIIDAEFTVVRE